MFTSQQHIMTAQTRDAIQCLLGIIEERPIWLSDLVDSTSIDTFFKIQHDQALWLIDCINLLSNSVDSELKSRLNYLVRQFDPQNFYLIQTGICSPTY